jgi:hypothetical protein
MADLSVHLPDTNALLQGTIARFVSGIDRITDTKFRVLEPGMSGRSISRVRVRYIDDRGLAQATSLILKQASQRERRVLDRLQALPNRHVPFNHARPTEGDDAGLLCMQDLGERIRPSSLDPIDPVLEQREADGLADIHLAHFAAPDLDWLPAADEGYFAWTIERQFFRPAWERAKQDPTFVEHFGSVIARVERRADSIVGEMTDLSQESAWRTLVHTDLNPSNVLVWQDHPYVIDWDTAHVGSLFLDLPHHFPTLEQAERYRTALTERGMLIDRATFAGAHTIAARYVGLRYLWWTLAAWHHDPTAEPWVQHYLGMILQ